MPIYAYKMHKYEVTLVGAKGYSGLDLAKILITHPHARLSSVLTSDQSPFSLEDALLDSRASQIQSLPLSDWKSLKVKPSIVFLATPAEVSLEWAPKFLEAGVSVIDLSGAYRLEAADYPKWYGLEHPEHSPLAQATYGLSPFDESFPKTGTFLISNPGCYVTSVLMALIPLLREGLIDPTNLVIDSKSGTTGAGRKASTDLLFSEVDGECLPYKIGKHQHYPEIVRHLETYSGVKTSPFFTTQLLTVRRGILSSIYAHVKPGVTTGQIAAAFNRTYANYPLVRHAAATEARAKSLLSLKRVAGTPYTNLVYSVTDSKLYLFSVIDNLMKGAASQAVENFNRAYGLPINTGLSSLEGVL
ncbi:MAG: N-acetyl-gamma-glutamyl-phosphate reductase [Proteobacteria bacterium]|nr:MAG: N-acetyl-gamma-glutamyl-phosphate reductase [Pseudomonadota bacterium]